MASCTHFDAIIPPEAVEPLERLRRLQATAAGNIGMNGGGIEEVEAIYERHGIAFDDGWPEAEPVLAAEFQVPSKVAARQLAALEAADGEGGDWKAVPLPGGGARVSYAEDFAWNPFDAALRDALLLAGSDAEGSYRWSDAGWDRVEQSGLVRITKWGKTATPTDPAEGQTLRAGMLEVFAKRLGHAEARLRIAELDAFIGGGS